MKKLTVRFVTCSAVLLALVAVMFLAAPQLNAQSAFGGVVGTVTDSSGAAVPGVNVTITNLGTNEKKVVQSDASGNYRLVNLLPAQYKVEFEKASFKKLVQSPVSVLVDSTGRLDVTLEVGAVSETVEVTTQAPLLQTESGTLGGQVEGKVVEQMPLNGRNTMNLIALVPGVVPQGSSMGNTTMNQGTHTNNAGWGNFQIGGAIAGQGSMMVDGAPLNVLYGHFVAFVPTQDATQEFKVATNSASAEFGRYAGGVVEMTTKSGTNQFHGSAYEYLRNTVLNANVWNPTGTIKKGAWIQNQYGVAVGGPVIRDKAFFFFSWEKFSSRTAQVTSTNVPDTYMMSDTDPSVPGDLTSKAGFALPASQAGCLTYGTDLRTHLKPSCVDATSKVMKKYFQTATTAPNPKNNYNVQVPLGDDNYQYNVRGDANITANQRLFMRYSYLHTWDMSSDSMFSANGFRTGGATSIYPTHQAVVGDTVTLNPTTILDVRLSYLRTYFNDAPPSEGSDLNSLGFGPNWTAIQSQQIKKLLPVLSLGGGYALWNFRGQVFQERWDNIYGLNGSLIKILGAHTFKFGGQVNLYDNNATPQSDYGTVRTNATTYAQDEWMNFLLGDTQYNTFSKPARTTSYNWYQGYYVNDTWNAGRKLTITAGLRWELPGSMAEKKDRGTIMLPDVTQTINGLSAKGILALVNSSQYSDRGTEPSKHNLFSPRLGVAYRLTDKTVLRAGYALAYLPPNIALGMQPNASPINLAPTRADNTSNTLQKYSVFNPFGAGTSNAVAVNQPVGRDPNFMNSYANVTPLQAINGPVPTSKFPYMQQWNFTLGQEFKGAQSIEATYAGAVGIHLPMPGQAGWGLNQLAKQYADQLTAGTLTTTAAQLLRPHPSYQNFSDANPLIGTMTYNAFQFKYVKRFGAQGISSGYTFSKAIGDTDTVSPFLDQGFIGAIQDFNNQKAERSILSYSIAQRWVTTYMLDLPFGKGKKYANGLNGIADRLVGGWSVNGITTLQTGQPISIIQNNNTYSTNFGAGTTRPNVTAGCAKATSGSAQARLGAWFDTSCYSKVGNYVLGNEPRVEPKLQTSGVANWDFTTQKTTRITEGTNLQFRMEFFNIFNRRQFNQPANNISNNTFGTITTQKNNPRQIQASLRFSF